MINQSPRYTVDQAPTPNIGINFGVYYHEVAIDNAFSEDIVMVDGNLRKIRVPGKHNTFGTAMVVQGCITIYMREHVGPRQDYEKKSLVVTSVPIAVKRVQLNRYELDRGPIYIPEINAVFGLLKDFDSITHPHAVPELYMMLDQMMSRFDGCEDESSIRFVANDPNGRSTSMFVQMLTRVVEIPVYHYKHNAASLIVVMRGKFGEQYREEIDLEPLYSEDKDVLPVSFGSYLISRVSLDRDVLEEEVFKAIHADTRFDADRTATIVDDMKTRHAAAIKDLESRHHRELQFLKDEHDTQIQMKNHELKQRDLKISDLEMQLTSWKHLHDAHTKKMTADADRLVEEMKVKEAMFKAKKSELEYQGVMWKVLGGAAIAVGTFVLTSKFKK